MNPIPQTAAAPCPPPLCNPRGCNEEGCLLSLEPWTQALGFGFPAASLLGVTWAGGRSQRLTCGCSYVHRRPLAASAAQGGSCSGLPSPPGLCGRMLVSRKAWRLVATPSPVPRFPHLLCEDCKTWHLKEGVCANCKYSVIVLSLCSCLFLCLLQSLLFVYLKFPSVCLLQIPDWSP